MEKRTLLTALAFVLPAAFALATGCGGSNNSSGFGQSSSSGGGSSGGSSGGGSGGSSGGSSSGGSSSGSIIGDAAPPKKDSGPNTGCTNIQCNIHSCGDGGAHTTLTGKVMDPAGKNPLYNVVVYIPNSMNGALDPIPIGVNSTSCSCGALFSGSPIVDAVTDEGGNFTLTDVPDGQNIPLVVQIGKWRKEIIIPSITACMPNKVSAPITLPKNLSDGKYASMPNIAVSTGRADTLECLLTRVGVDQSVFTGNPAGPGVHVFQGYQGKAATGSGSSPTTLWDSENDLLRYDIVMLSCEGQPTTGVDGTTASYLGPYLDKGGRVFAEHYHYQFFVDSTSGTSWSQFPNVATWANLGLGGADAPYTNDISNVIQTTLPNGKPFPEGAALKTWLGNVGALTNGELVVPVANARDNATVSGTNVSTPWTQTDQSVNPASTQYFSWDQPFNPPVNDAGAPEYCGRAVYSDMHVSGSANDYPGGTGTVPSGCDATSTLSPDEDAIEFILFDLSSCIVPVGFTPVPPPTPEGGIQ